MKEVLVLFFTGVFFLVVGVWTLKRDTRLMKNAVRTTAKVMPYDEYLSTNDSDNAGSTTMYTMNVTYTIWDGTVINAKEQAGKSNKKYEEGDYIDIQYSKEKCDFFMVCGDNSRKIAFIIVIILGLLSIALSGYIGINRYIV